MSKLQKFLVDLVEAAVLGAAIAAVGLPDTVTAKEAIGLIAGGTIGALKGALHGGANEAVMHTFDEIGTGDGAGQRAELWLNTALTEKRKIMGFGHRVYKNGDSRVPTMKAALDRLVTHTGRADILELYTALEQAMGAAKDIKPNLDYPSGPAYNLIGFDTASFTPIFVASRITGWTAHILEQAAANALIRPLSHYNGPDERHITQPTSAGSTPTVSSSAQPAR